MRQSFIIVVAELRILLLPITKRTEHWLVRIVDRIFPAEFLGCKGSVWPNL